MYKKIRSVKSTVKNQQSDHRLTDAVKRLKQAQMKTDRNKVIYKENRRLYNQILQTNTLDSPTFNQQRPSLKASGIHRSVSRGKRNQER